jgi:uncharacterized protein (TIGR02145 family)
MTVASEIVRLQGVKTNILNAISAKGVTVPSGSKLADCPDLIAAISGGGESTAGIIQPFSTSLSNYRTIATSLKNNRLTPSESGNAVGANFGDLYDISSYDELIFKTKLKYNRAGSTYSNGFAIGRQQNSDYVFVLEFESSIPVWFIRIQKDSSKAFEKINTGLMSSAMLNDVMLEVKIIKTTRALSMKVNGTEVFSTTLSFEPYYGTQAGMSFGLFSDGTGSCSAGDWIDLGETSLTGDGHYIMGGPKSSGFDTDSIVNIVPIDKMVVVDANGYIGFDLTNYFQTRGSTFYYNYAILSADDDFSDKGLGQVTFYTPTSNVIGGRTYRSVIIGGVEWLAENLDFKFSGLAFGQSGMSSSEPRGNYYQNNASTYGNYGILYNWIAVKYLEDNKSSLIPGWHVPTNAEWNALAMAVGGASIAGTKLKSTTDWSSGAGTDDYGFSALPAGGYYNSTFSNLGRSARFWTTDVIGDFAYSRAFNTTELMDSSNSSKSSQYSVRLVKDIPGNT